MERRKRSMRSMFALVSGGRAGSSSLGGGWVVMVNVLVSTRMFPL